LLLRKNSIPYGLHAEELEQREHVGDFVLQMHMGEVH
jgi:hypothetical protein